MAKSKIEWTQATWNPVTGCSKISDGCLNCYAEKMHKRLQAMGLEKYSEPFSVVRFCIHHLNIPSKTKKPTVFFVNSMSDLFHEDLKKQYLFDIFREMVDNPQHIFLILTKRPENIPIWKNEKPYQWEYYKRESYWTDNIWLGVTIESSKYLHRAETLQKIPAKHKFISFEPLIGSPLIPGVSVLNSNYYKVDWIIVGGETGINARVLQPAYVSVLRDFTEYENIPFFFKQWGGKEKNAFLGGKEYKQFPAEIAKLMEGKNSRVNSSRKMQNLPGNLHQD